MAKEIICKLDYILNKFIITSWSITIGSAKNILQVHLVSKSALSFRLIKNILNFK